MERRPASMPLQDRTNACGAFAARFPANLRRALREWRLLAERRIDRIELPDQRRPFEQAELAAHAGLIEVRCVLDDLARRERDLGVAGERRHLQLAGALQAEDVVER